MYIGGKNMAKVKVGKKEKVIIEFLAKNGGSAWKSDILYRFSRSIKYDAVLNARLQRMAQKGLIEIHAEINPASGRNKQRVYLKQ